MASDSFYLFACLSSICPPESEPVSLARDGTSGGEREGEDDVGD